MISDGALAVSNAIYIVLNSIWWHSVLAGTICGFAVGSCIANLLWRQSERYWRNESKFWEKHSRGSLEIADGWKKILRDINPHAFDAAKRIAEQEMAARKRMN
jgi:hypothetical protein